MSVPAGVDILKTDFDGMPEPKVSVGIRHARGPLGMAPPKTLRRRILPDPTRKRKRLPARLAGVTRIGACTPDGRPDPSIRRRQQKHGWGIPGGTRENATRPREGSIGPGSYGRSLGPDRAAPAAACIKRIGAPQFHCGEERTVPGVVLREPPDRDPEQTEGPMLEGRFEPDPTPPNAAGPSRSR